MRSVTVEFEADHFRFSGQSSIEAWTLKQILDQRGWSGYDQFLSQEPVLFMERVKQLAFAFPTWQRHAATGRKATEYRDLIIALLLKQFMRISFRSLEGELRLLAGFFEMTRIPDGNTLSRWNRSRQFAKVLRRFHEFVLYQLPARKAIIATDATGYGSSKIPWRETDYGLRATQPWVKSHCAIEVPQLLYLSSVSTSGRVHESQVFERVWVSTPRNVEPVRSLADSAYTGEACLSVAKQQGATPLHGLKKNARHTSLPQTNYQRLVNFAKHWPNRFASLTGKRSLAETTFSMTKNRFGDRLRCRHPIARRNEVQAKETSHNIRVIAMRELVGST